MLQGSLVIGCDMDEIIYQWVRQAVRLLQVRTQRLIDPPKVYATNHEEWGSDITAEDWEWLWNDVAEHLFMGGLPFDGAAGALAKMRRFYGQVHIITQRPFGFIHNLHIKTELWLRAYGIEYDVFHPVWPDTNKAKSHYPCDVYIDDSPKVAKDILANTDAVMVLWRRSHNQELWDCEDYFCKPRRFYTVGTWEQVFGVLDAVKAAKQTTAPVQETL